jgi:hypothetical protein
MKTRLFFLIFGLLVVTIQLAAQANGIKPYKIVLLPPNMKVYNLKKDALVFLPGGSKPMFIGQTYLDPVRFLFRKLGDWIVVGPIDGRVDQGKIFYASNCDASGNCDILSRAVPASKYRELSEVNYDNLILSDKTFNIQDRSISTQKITNPVLIIPKVDKQIYRQ